MKLTRNIFPLICLIFSLFLLFYIFFKSEITYSGDKRSYYAIYFGISIFLIGFSIILFYINQKLKTYIIIIASSIVITLYLFEGYMSFYNKTNPLKLYKKVNEYKEQTGKKYDTRSPIKVYEDLKNRDQNIVITIGPHYLDKEKLYSLSGISNSKTIFCNESGYYATYKSDRYGFNNPDSEWNKKDIKYLLVGDSFIHGQCVNRPNDIASVLRTLSKKSALNLGYRGNGPLTEYATLREYLKPGVENILWFYFENSDVYDLDYELNSEILLNYIKDENFTQNLISRQHLIDKSAKTLMQTMFEHHKSLKFIKLYRLRALISEKIKPPGKQLKVQLEFKEIMKKANSLAVKNNSKLYFIYLPHYARYKINYTDPNYGSVKKIIEDMKIPFIDISKEVFEKESNPLELYPFQMYNHYTIEGYHKISKKIHQIIEK